jgi:hypothetical protein
MLAVLYGYKTWSLALREERRLRMFENRVLRKIFERKRVEVTRRLEKNASTNKSIKRNTTKCKLKLPLCLSTTP